MSGCGWRLRLIKKQAGFRYINTCTQKTTEKNLTENVAL